MTKRKPYTVLFAVTMPSIQLLVDAEGLQKIAEVLANVEGLRSNYERDENGKYQTIKTLTEFGAADLAVGVVTADEYNSIKMITEARKAENKE